MSCANIPAHAQELEDLDLKETVGGTSAISKSCLIHFNKVNMVFQSSAGVTRKKALKEQYLGHSEA